ncbi:uncharacterized protein LOC109625331 [Tachysurus ichikawai]
MSKTVRYRMSPGFITTSMFSSLVDNYRICPSCDVIILQGCACSRAMPDSKVCAASWPESIPQFTVPKLTVEQQYTQSPKERETKPGEDTAWKLAEDPTIHPNIHPYSSPSSSSLFSSSPALGRKARRSISDPDNNRHRSPSTFMESDQCSDPATRGALSQSYLAKITTPYGFVTPQMANKEVLFLQGLG